MNTNTPAAELEAWSAKALRAGRNDIVRLCYSLRMIQDANRIQDPISKADRFLLAVNAMREGVAAARQVDSEAVETARRALNDFEPQYEQLSIQCIENYHAERREVLGKSASGKRQLSSARATLKKLKRLESRYPDDAPGRCFRRVWQYWQDQEALLERHGS